MKKFVVAGLLVVAALALVATGVAFAQSPEPPVPGAGNGYGGGRGRMMAGAQGGLEGPMHEYMDAAITKALGISEAEFEARRDAGKTAYQIALDLGFSADEIPTLLSNARSGALDAAVAAKVITQEQADWMKSRQARMGDGNCYGNGEPGMGPGAGFGMGRGFRFQQSTP
jgi:hypothetical protein